MECRRVEGRGIEEKDESMEQCHYFHFFANGDDAKGFITCDRDFYAAFNRMGVCAFIAGVCIVSFSIEESHPHALIYGTLAACYRFKALYENSTRSYIASTRGNLDGVVFECEIYPVDDQDYLRNVAAYTIVQPTKDGKDVMPYDYLWGTGSMYFRREGHSPIWLYDSDGRKMQPTTIGELTVSERRKLLHTKLSVPDDWLVCNGFLLPDNYVDVKTFENIYRTANCFRVFMSSSKQRMDVISKKMYEVRGVMMDDLEAYRICSDEAHRLFGVRDVRKLDANRRMELASVLRRAHKMSVRQTATMVRLPESEIRKYLY